MTDDRPLNPETLLVSGGGEPPSPWPSGMSTPLFPSATYDLHPAAYGDIAATGGQDTWWYTRLRNPTVEAVAEKLARLEGADGAILFSSGMAAIATTLIALLPPGATVVAARDLYGDVFTLLSQELTRQGREVVFVAVDDHAGWEEALARGASMLYVETLSNPMMRLADLPVLAELAHRHGAVAVADATFTPPTDLRALDHGFDVVLHSATKYLNGHSDLIAGVMAGRATQLEPVRTQATMLGGCLDPFGAWLLERGLKTLAVRMDRQRATARTIAQELTRHDEVDAVAHPQLPDHPDHRLAARLLPGGAALLSFRVKGGDERALRVLAAMEVIRQATSLGGVESLASAPHNTSHLGLTPAQLTQAGIEPGTIRLSVGLENPADLIDDLRRALRVTAEASPPASGQ
jgi:cystathionine beta-lyase/cystathionine gamma-synthase